MKEQNIDESPFYIEPAGNVVKSSGYNFRPKENISNDIDKFLNSRFDGLSKSQMMEQIVYDYYFRYAPERTYYERTFVALLHKEELSIDKPTFIPLFVLDRFPKDNENNVIIDNEMILNYDIMQYLAWSDKFEDITDDMEKRIIKLIFEDSFDTTRYDVFKNMKDFNEDSLKNFFVVEIPLNNYLDVKQNGVYGVYDFNTGLINESKHHGLAIIKDNDKDVNASPIPIIYKWSLNSDFSIDALDIVVSKINLEDLKELCQKLNPQLFWVLNFFEISNFGFEDKLKANLQKQRELEEELEDLQEQQRELEYCIENQKLDK